MTTSLQKKIRAVEEDHAEEFINNRLQNFAQNQRDEAAVAIGVIGAFEKLSSVLSAESMKALIKFQEMKMHESLGYERFENFLNESPYSPMTKHQFYDRLKLLKNEGDTLFDLFNNVGIPVSKRKLLSSGEAGQISIEGDEIIIGEERADLSDLPTIKTLIKNLANENRQLTETGEKNKKHFEKLKDQIATGQNEYQELQRAMDAASDGTPYEKALTKAVGALINLTIAAVNSPLVEKNARGRADIETLWNQMLNVRAALYQDDFVFTDQANTERRPISALAKKALADADDFGDEDEK